MNEEYADGIFDLMEDHDHLMTGDEALDFTEAEINRRLKDPKDNLCMVSPANISETFCQIGEGDLAGLSAAIQSGHLAAIGREVIAVLHGYWGPIVREAVEYEVSCMEIKE